MFQPSGPTIFLRWPKITEERLQKWRSTWGGCSWMSSLCPFQSASSPYSAPPPHPPPPPVVPSINCWKNTWPCEAPYSFFRGGGGSRRDKLLMCHYSALCVPQYLITWFPSGSYVYRLSYASLVINDRSTKFNSWNSVFVCLYNLSVRKSSFLWIRQKKSSHCCFLFKRNFEKNGILNFGHIKMWLLSCSKLFHVGLCRISIQFPTY